MARTITHHDGSVWATCPRCGIDQPAKEADAEGACLPDCEARAIRAGGLFRVTHQGVEVFRGSEGAALAFVHRSQPQSYSYASRHGGWRIERADERR